MTSVPATLEGRVIAFFHQSADLYGSDKVLLDLATAVLRLGGGPVVLLPVEGPLTVELAARGIEYHVLPVMKLSRARFGPMGLLSLWAEGRKLRAACDRVFSGRRVALVHSNTIAVLGGALWARARSIPHLWHVHEIIEKPALIARVFPWMVRLLADRVVCNSKATSDWMVGAQPGLRGKTSVIWNGVPGGHAPAPDDAAFQALCRAFRPESSALAIGLVGRFNRWKGQPLLLRAAALLHAKGLAGFSLVFIGSPPPGQEHYREDLCREAAASPLSGRIVIQDFLRDIAPAFAALDIVCVPSTEPEPFGLVAVEAMAMSRPVVAANFGGLTEIVVDGVTGRTFTPRSAEALASALEELIRDDALRQAMGHAARARFVAEFTVDMMVERFRTLYLAMMEPAR